MHDNDGKKKEWVFYNDGDDGHNDDSDDGHNDDDDDD